MEYEVIKETVRKHLECHDSLCLTKHRKSDNVFFYNIPSDEINRLLSQIDISSSIVSRCDFDCNWEDNNANYLCVKMVRHEPDTVELYLYSFDRIRITFLKRGKKAELKTGRLLFKMAINTADNQFYWFDSVHNYHPLRFYYDLNKMLWTCRPFRRIFADLLSLMPDSCLLRDLISDIRRYGYILPLITVADASQFHSKKELMREYYPCDLQLNFNTLTINEGYAAAVTASRVVPEDHFLLTEYIKQNPSGMLNSWPELDSIAHSPLIGDFMFNYYNNLFKQDDFICDCHIDPHYVTDYLNMIQETGDRLKLSFHSASQFVRFHDSTVKEYMKRKKAENLEQDIIPANSRFTTLREILPSEFEWINTTDRLYEEGEKQHNCVFSYRNRIVNDDCAVYHWETEGREYTIEFTVSSRGVFRVKQMMQKFNFPFLEADARKVSDYLAGYNNAVLIH